MQIRTSVESDLDRILAAIADQSVNTVHPDRYRSLLASGAYRPEWTYLAEEAGRVVAVAVWFGFGGRPAALDGLFAAPDVTDPRPLWTALIERVRQSTPPEAEPPEYHIFLPPGWREDVGVTAALAPRTAAARAAGLTSTLERLRFAWTADMPVPPRSTRVVFRPEPDDEVFADVFRQVAAGSLDDHTRSAVARAGLHGYAREELETYLRMRGERSWWRLAYDTAGDLVGFAIPSANDGGPVVGFLGVVPRRRGHGYGDDLLAEITADLAGYGARRIGADTDLANTPMAAAFTRLGYRRIGVRLVLGVPSGATAVE